MLKIGDICKYNLNKILKSLYKTDLDYIFVKIIDSNSGISYNCIPVLNKEEFKDWIIEHNHFVVTKNNLQELNNHEKLKYLIGNYDDI